MISARGLFLEDVGRSMFTKNRPKKFHPLTLQALHVLHGKTKISKTD